MEALTIIVKYNTHKYEGKHPELEREQLPIEKFCCETMQNVFEDTDDGFKFVEKSTESNKPFFKLTLHSYEYGERYDHEYPVNFCPFCGERITLEQVHYTEYTKVIETEKEPRQYERWIKKH